MPRKTRVEFAGAVYHLLDRGDRREPIFRDERDREIFLATLGQASERTGWRVHAWVLMTNHYHLLVETPQPNLVAGMRWFQTTYTVRFNRRHKHWGHLFGGRYKAQQIDGRSQDYLRRACDHVHLNPVRAGMIAKDARLCSYRWSSYPGYRRARLRPPWLRVDRVLGEHGLGDGSAASRREFDRRMNQRRLEPEEEMQLRRGWKIGAEDFRDWLAEKLSRRGRKGEQARERAETDEALAEGMVLEALAAIRWREIDLALQPKGHRVKVEIAQRLRGQTAMTRQWIADRLRMGSASYVSNLLNSVDS